MFGNDLDYGRSRASVSKSRRVEWGDVRATEGQNLRQPDPEADRTSLEARRNELAKRISKKLVVLKSEQVSFSLLHYYDAS